jgi:Fur family transcriptional regulator, peroxide stress response regulator
VSKLARKITTAFRTAALRSTPQRYAVLEFLVCHPVHATAEEILREINRADPRASRATVYNNLNALTAAGLVREVAGEGKAARFDANLNRHHHFVCDACGGVEDIEWFDVPAPVARQSLCGRQARTCEVVFRGTCARCSHRKKGER